MLQEFKVTIGLCVKNTQQTIRQSLSSILEQSFPHELIETVVVDGCSKDETLSIIKKELSNSNLNYKVFHENSGLGQARQIVVDNALGDYIVWVDGDTILSKDFVSKQVEFMERNPKVGIGKGKYEIGNDTSLVATLEDIEFVVSFRREGITSSKTLATSGCIYRVEAIRQVGGFDENITGVGEDMDAEHRVRASGWLLCITPASFCESRRKTWKSLWDEYYWHGCGGRYLSKKNRGIIDFYKAFPPFAVSIQLSHASEAYKLLRRRVVFLLPFHYAFKRAAWILGFMKSTRNSK